MKALSTGSMGEKDDPLLGIYKSLNYNNRDNDEVKFLRGIKGAAHAAEVFGPNGVWVYNLLLDFLKSPAGAMSLEKLLDSGIERKNVSGDKAKCIAEIGRFWEKLTSRVMESQGQQKPLINNQVPENTKKKEAKPQKALQEMNAGGDDRNLSTHGSDGSYWYSIRDGMALLVAIRKSKLGYKAGYNEYTENKKSVFLANPYHELSFKESLLGDIERIMGGHGIQAWKQRPKILIIPVLSGLHWRCIRIEINYNTKQVSILFDDPYGKGRFNEGLKSKIRNSIQQQLPKLFLVEAREVSYAEYEKEVNQQGDDNGSDCGPIVFGNAEEYCDASKANRSFTTKDGFTIVSEAKDLGHNKTMEDLRFRHIKRFNKVSGIPINEERLKNIREAISRSNNEKKLSFSSDDTDIISQIEALPAEYVSHIFHAVDLGISLKEAYESIMAERQIEVQQTSSPKEYVNPNSKVKHNKVDILKEESFQNNEDQEIRQKSSKKKNKLQVNLKNNYLNNKYLPRLLEDEDFKKQEIESTYVNLMLIEREEEKDKSDTPKAGEGGKSAQEGKVYGSYEEIAASKREIEIEEIFDKQKAEVNKVLIYGRAGIGKTTLCNYISYKWSQSKLWKDKFNYVFWLPLRELNGDWYNGYERAELRDYPVECFIKRYCLGRDRDFSIKDIAEVIEKGRVLLILDGYDEIASYHSEKHTVVKDVIDSAIGVENAKAKVIMTSRPNAVSNTFRKSFDAEIENTGLKIENVYEYIDKYKFKEKEKAEGFKVLIKRHGHIESIAQVPINLYLLCLIWDKEGLKSQENITVTALYEKVVEWLMKRYLSKFKGKGLTAVNWDGIEEGCIEESSLLEKLAYCGVRSKTAILRSEECKGSGVDWKKLSALKALGILSGKGVEEATDEYEFIHLTFQEYFAARHIVKLLESKELEEVKEGVRFINENKYDRAYERVVLFVSGLVALEAKKEEGSVAALKHFWNTLINGSADLRVANQLLLLTRSLEEGQCSKKIPGTEVILSAIKASYDFLCRSSVFYTILFSSLATSRQVLKKSGVMAQLESDLQNEEKFKRAIHALETIKILDLEEHAGIIDILFAKMDDKYEVISAVITAFRYLKIEGIGAQRKITERAFARLNTFSASKDDGWVEQSLDLLLSLAINNREVGDGIIGIFSMLLQEPGKIMLQERESYGLKKDVVLGLQQWLRKDNFKNLQTDRDLGLKVLMKLRRLKPNEGMQKKLVVSLLSMLKTVDRDLRSEVFIWLQKFKLSEGAQKKLVLSLLSMLQTVDWDLRREVFMWLPELKLSEGAQKKLVLSLLSMLQTVDWDLRREVFMWLPELKLSEGVQKKLVLSLLSMLQTVDWDLRREVFKWLPRLKLSEGAQKKLVLSLLLMLQTVDWDLRREVFMWLPKFKLSEGVQKELVLTLVQMLKNEDVGSEILMDVINTLVETIIKDKDLQGQIIELLGILKNHKDSYVSVGASIGLLDMGVGNLVEQKDRAIELFGQGHNSIRRAITALGRLKIADRELEMVRTGLLVQVILGERCDYGTGLKKVALQGLLGLQIESKEERQQIKNLLSTIISGKSYNYYTGLKKVALQGLLGLQIESKEERQQIKNLLSTIISGKSYNYYTGLKKVALQGLLGLQIESKEERQQIKNLLRTIILGESYDYYTDLKKVALQGLLGLQIESEEERQQIKNLLSTIILGESYNYYTDLKKVALQGLLGLQIESEEERQQIKNLLSTIISGKSYDYDTDLKKVALQGLLGLQIESEEERQQIKNLLSTIILGESYNYDTDLKKAMMRGLKKVLQAEDPGIKEDDALKKIATMILLSRLEKQFDIQGNKAISNFLVHCLKKDIRLNSDSRFLEGLLLNLDNKAEELITLSNTSIIYHYTGYKVELGFGPLDRELLLKIWEHFRKRAEAEGLPTEMLDSLITGRPWIEIEGIEPEIDKVIRNRITKHQEDIMIVRDNLELGSFLYAKECRADLALIKEGGQDSERLIAKYKGQEDSPILIVAMEALRDDPSNAQIKAFLSGLLANKIGLGALDSMGNTVAHYAMRHKRADILELVANEGFYSKETTNSFGANALHTAVYYDMAYELDRMLGEGNCNFDQKAELGDYTFTPIELAVALGKVMAIELIFSMSGLGSTSKWCDKNILNIATKFKQDGALHYLIYQDKQPISANTLQDAYLYAARECNINALIIIQRAFGNDRFKGHCSITKAGSNGNTALHEAVEVGNKDVIKYLLIQDRELLNRLNKANKTPIGVAEQEANKEGKGPLYEQITNILRVEVGLADRKRFEIPEITKVPIKNLVIKGGGPKGIAFIGALEEFGEERLKGVERIAGTSAGAITAGLLAVGYKPKEIREILNNLNLLSLIDSPNQAALLKLVKSKEKLKEVWNQKGAKGHKLLFEIISDLGDSNGLCSGDEFERIMEGLICSKTGKQNFTLGELASKVRKGEEGYKELYVVTLDIEAESVEKGLIILSTEDERYRDVSVSEAIRASMSIPVVFKPKVIKYREVDGSYKSLRCMDGGTVYNYPIDLFDKVKFRYTGRMTGGGAKKVYNEYTLGLSLYSQEIVEQSREGEKAKSHGTSILEMLTEKVFGHMTGESLKKLKGEADSIKGIVLRVINLIGSAELVKGSYWEDNDKPRTVNINCLEVGLLDFDLDQEMKDRLIGEGTRAFREKFEMEKSEEPRRDEVKKLLSLTATEPGPTTPLAVATSTWIPPIVADNPKTSVAIGVAAIAVGAIAYAKQEDSDKCVLF